MSNKLKKIEISAFRAFNEKQVFDFTCNNKIANLVVIFGPNGFGKTSFLDAVEWGLTGKINRITKNKILNDKANSEYGYILKNTKSNLETGQVIFVADNNESMIRTTQKLNGKIKRDYKVGEQEFNGETFKGIFKEGVNNNNILAHDQIDSFLKSVTPEQRYNSLVSFWDYANDAEEYQKILEVYKIGQDNIKEKKGDLKNKKKDLKKLKSEIYSLDKLNNDLESINKSLGKNINLLREDFTKRDLDDIRESLLAYISKIEENISNKKDTYKKLEYLSRNYNEYQSNCKSYRDGKEIIKKLNEKLNLYKEYTDKINKKNEQDEIIKKLEYKSKTINYMLENIDEFNSKMETIKRIKSDIKELDISINKLQQVCTEIDSRIQVANIQINNKLKNINIYKRKILNSEKFLEIKISLKKNETDRRELYIQLKNVKNKIAKLESYNKDSEELIENIYKIDNMDKLNLGLSKYEKYYDEMKIVFELYDAIQNNIVANTENIKQLIDIENDAKELVTIGLKYIENLKTNICPLCNSEFKNYSTLINSINTKIYNAKVIEKLKYDTEQLKIHEKKLGLDIKNKKNQIINDVKLSINNRNHKIVELELKAKEVDEKIINLESEIKLLNGEKDIVAIDFLEEEILTLNESDKYDTLTLRWQKQMTEINKELESVKSSIKKYESEKSEGVQSINQLKKAKIQKIGQVSSIKSNEVIENLNIQMKENSINCKEDIINLKNEVDKKIKLIIDEKNKIDDHIKVLIPQIDGLDEKKIQKKIQMQNSSIEELGLAINTYRSYSESIKEVNQEKFDNTMLDTIMKNKEINIDEQRKIQEYLRSTLENILLLNNNMKFNSLCKEIINDESYIKYLEEMNKNLEQIQIKSTEYVENKINKAFDTDIINSIYDMIEPHPELKKIKITPKFNCNRPQLDIYALSKNGEKYEPALYLSSAQLNILSLSIFLARTLQENSNNMNTIFMDDTVEHLDSINTLSFIDLIRNIISVLDIQIVITTHSEDLFNLFKRKIDPQYYNAKYLELDGFGVLKKE